MPCAALRFGRGLFRLRYGNGSGIIIPIVSARRQVWNILAIVAAELDGHVFVDGAGVRLLFSDAKSGQEVQYFMGLDFQLPRQLVNSDLSHRQNYRFRRTHQLLIAAILLLTAGFRRFVIGGTSVFYRSRLAQ